MHNKYSQQSNIYNHIETDTYCIVYVLWARQKENELATHSRTHVLILLWQDTHRGIESKREREKKQQNIHTIKFKWWGCIVRHCIVLETVYLVVLLSLSSPLHLSIVRILRGAVRIQILFFSVCTFYYWFDIRLNVDQYLTSIHNDNSSRWGGGASEGGQTTTAEIECKIKKKR